MEIAVKAGAVVDKERDRPSGAVVHRPDRGPLRLTPVSYVQLP